MSGEVKIDVPQGTTVTKLTGIPIYRPFCSLYTLILIGISPLILLLLVLGFVWLLLSIVYGILMIPFTCCYGYCWLSVFFRDLCGSPMTSDEEAEVESALDAAVKAQFGQSKPPPANPERPHSKPHAILTGTFTVADNLPENLRVGVFSKPATYTAVVRSSEGVSTTADSPAGGPQGFAVKLCHVPSALGGGNYFWEDDGKKWVEEAKMAPATYDDGTQEFDLITASPIVTFLVKYTREMNWLANIQSPGVSCCTHIRQLLYLPTVRPIYKTIHMLWTAYWQQDQRGPLGWAYHSVMPYKFGEDRVVKFYFVPEQKHEHPTCCPGVCCACCNMTCAGCCCANILTTEISDYISKQPATFGFYVQFQPPRTDPRHHDYPIENAYAVWDQDYSPLHRIGTLSLPVQNIDAKERWDLAQSIWYNPYNSMKLHAPLSAINRARHRLYITCGALREQRLGYKEVPRCPFLGAGMAWSGAASATASAPAQPAAAPAAAVSVASDGATVTAQPAAPVDQAQAAPAAAPAAAV